MTPQSSQPHADPPSVSTLARTTVTALVVAGVLLVTLVLPAEYGIDPIGTGRWLGLTEIASPSVPLIEVKRPEGTALAPVQNGPVGEYAGEFKLDVFEVVLQPYEYVEYKYQLEKGATMLFSWTASAALIQDFHGERAGSPTSGAPAEESFDKASRRLSSGSLTAPFTGIHGWYWENPGADTITIRLTSSGFYSAAVEIRSDRTRRIHELKGIETLAPPPGGPSRTGAGQQQTGDRR